MEASSEPIGARLDGDVIVYKVKHFFFSSSWMGSILNCYMDRKQSCVSRGGVTVIVTIVTIDKIDESAYQFS